ncbi:hypothetical protein NDA11_006421 [Ustilago hordei]|uniref:Uncharacterized protein n=1 Tax=Ustilago hordei TaxID=120017 RepID=I2FTP3_USTHO|nr:hypothetical protein NDA10_002557 [Ustilago hordei]KAJ1594829.1 hypothetical protein NDA11_006421 [Ustilago hordei]KAJ1597466.1 hypothetical protein NDA14_000589 [Ustilago hordei]UTT88685.1 hypothetical protein NDA17_005104 [Ustilago hordei]CCF50286.1 uncharacterized protein UHOR_14350 [Ustilago hordei]
MRPLTPTRTQPSGYFCQNIPKRTHSVDLTNINWKHQTWFQVHNRLHQARSKRCTTAVTESQMGSNREGSQAGIEFATTNVGSTNGSKDLNPSEASKRDTGDTEYWSDKSDSSDASQGSTSLAAGSQADSKESKLIRHSGCVKVATAKKVGGMHVFKKTQNHARAHKVLAARHCGPCKRCLQVSIDCMPADSGSYKMKCKSCHGKTHPPCHHKIWLDQTLVAKWDGLVSQGKTHIVADVMVYSSLKVFGHLQYDKIPLKVYIAGVAPKITRAHCRNKFDKFEPLENPFCSNKADQGKTSGAGYKEVVQHGKGTTTGQPTTTTAPNTLSSSKQTAAEAGLATPSEMRPSPFKPGPSLLQGYRTSPGRPVPLQSNINLAYRSVDIVKGSHAEAALKSISTSAKGLVESFGFHNCSEEGSGVKGRGMLRGSQRFC